jgi:hypothetical protein
MSTADLNSACAAAIERKVEIAACWLADILSHVLFKLDVRAAADASIPSVWNLLPGVDPT